MKYLILILSTSILLSGELEVDGDLKVTGTIQATTIDSLNQEIADLKLIISQLQAQMNNLLTNGDCQSENPGIQLIDACGICGGDNNDGEDDLFLLLSEIPDLEVKLMGLKREVEIQSMLYAFLTQKYEESKIQEARDTPTIQILDPANKPEKRYQPKRKLMVVGYSIIMLFLSMLYVVLIAYNKNVSPESLSG